MRSAQSRYDVAETGPHSLKFRGRLANDVETQMGIAVLDQDVRVMMTQPKPHPGPGSGAHSTGVCG